MSIAKSLSVIVVSTECGKSTIRNFSWRLLEGNCLIPRPGCLSPRPHSIHWCSFRLVLCLARTPMESGRLESVKLAAGGVVGLRPQTLELDDGCLHWRERSAETG